MTIRNLYPDAKPSLLLDFAKVKALDPRITFTRASSAVVVDATGVYREVSNNTPRFDHNPLTGESLGLLIEEQRTNGITNPRQPGGTDWTLTNIDSVTAITGLDGVAGSAATINEGTGTGNHFISATIPAVYSTTHTFSIFLRPGTCNRARVTFGGSGWGTTVTVTVLLTGDGTITSTGAGVTNSGIIRVNDWYRVFVTGASLTSGSTQVQLRMVNDAVSDNYTGTSRTIDVAWPQSEIGSFPTSPILPPVGAPAQSTRAADAANMTGANFSSWYRQDEGTFVIESRWFTKRPSFAVSYSFLANKIVGSSTTTGGIGIWNWAGHDNFNGYIFSDNGVNAFNPGITEAESGSTLITMTKQALAYRVNDSTIAANGFVATTDTTVTLPTGLNTLNLGFPSDLFTSQQVKRLIYYPARLSNTELQALTR